MDKKQKQVREFHKKHNLEHPKKALSSFDEGEYSTMVLRRIALINEEAAEFSAAACDLDLVRMADGLGDLLYVTYAAAVSLGIDLDRVFEAVHESNMSKSPRVGIGKVAKGDHYVAPKIREALAFQKEDIYAES